MVTLLADVSFMFFLSSVRPPFHMHHQTYERGALIQGSRAGCAANNFWKVGCWKSTLGRRVGSAAAFDSIPDRTEWCRNVTVISRLWTAGRRKMKYGGLMRHLYPNKAHPGSDRNSQVGRWCSIFSSNCSGVCAECSSLPSLCILNSAHFVCRFKTDEISWAGGTQPSRSENDKAVLTSGGEFAFSKCRFLI